VVQSETFAGYALFRSNLASHGDADVAKAAKYGKRLNPPETKFTDAKDILYDSTIWAVPAFPALVEVVRALDRIKRRRVLVE
jgi:hypothetical protein